MSLRFYIKVILSFITSKLALRHSFIMKNIRVLFRFTASPKKKTTLLAYPELERERYNARRANVK